ncbi:DUF6777 domain-containing protein [Streptomyces sp. NPDC003832]
MRTPTAILVMVCALALAFLALGRGRDARDTPVGADLLLRPLAARGPDPFTPSTALPGPAPVIRTPHEGATAPRSLPGSLPGLYGGTVRVGSCDVHRQIAHLTADPERARAFAGAAGIAPAALPDHLRRLTPVVLRADTRVSGHGYRAGRATSHQSVLQAGTAVLVDARGVPRLRCADGSPLKPPVGADGGLGTRGGAWAGYRPAEVVVVTAAPRPLTDLTLLDSADGTWIERRIGHDVRHDRTLPRPALPAAQDGRLPAREVRAEPSGADASATAPPDCPAAAVTGDAEPGEPAVDAGPGARSPAGTADCPAAATATAPDTPPGPSVPPPGESTAPRPPGQGTATVPTAPDTGTTLPDDPGASLGLPDEPGPESVPELPDAPDGGGLIPDDPEAPPIRAGDLGGPADGSGG